MAAFREGNPSNQLPDKGIRPKRAKKSFEVFEKNGLISPEEIYTIDDQQMQQGQQLVEGDNSDMRELQAGEMLPVIKRARPVAWLNNPHLLRSQQK